MVTPVALTRELIPDGALRVYLSNEPPDAPLPPLIAEAVSSGREPFLVVGAMAGG